MHTASCVGAWLDVEELGWMIWEALCISGSG